MITQLLRASESVRGPNHFSTSQTTKDGGFSQKSHPSWKFPQSKWIRFSFHVWIPDLRSQRISEPLSFFFLYYSVDNDHESKSFRSNLRSSIISYSLFYNEFNRVNSNDYYKYFHTYTGYNYRKSKTFFNYWIIIFSNNYFYSTY